MRRFILLVLAVILISGGAQAQLPPRTPTFSPDEGVNTRAVTADEFAAAMDIPTEQIIQASLGESDPKGAKTFSAPFSDFPTQGDSFTVLSTGKAKDAPSPNVSESLSTPLDGLKTSEGEDLVQLTLRLSVPQNATFWAVDFKFLSEEYVEFVDSAYNDAFFIETPNSTFIINDDSTVEAPDNVAFDPAGNPVTINATGPTGMSRANAMQTTYDGATRVLTAYAPIPAGATEVKIIFSVVDIADSIFDTAAFIDNFRFLFGEGGPGDSAPPTFTVPPTSPVGTVFEVEVGQPLSISLQASDPDATDTVTINILETITGASVTSTPANPATGTFNWTPAVGQEGVYVIPFIARDNNGAASAPHNLVVTVGNIAPEAVNDQFNGSVGFPLDEFAPGVLENDSDVNEDLLVVNTTPVQQPVSGSLTLAADGSFEYIPNTNFSGVDVFTYEVSDGEFTDTAQSFVKVGSSLLFNEGFEFEGFTKQDASLWNRKTPTQDQRLCDKPLKDKNFAFTGQCAFVFSAASDSGSSISQSVSVSPGSTATLVLINGWVKTEALAAAGKIKVVAKHTSNTKDKFTIDLTPGTADYTQVAGEILLTGEPSKLKVKISIGTGTGKFTIDDVFLSLDGGSAVKRTTDSTIPLPSASH